MLTFRYASAAALAIADDEALDRLLLIDPCLDPQAALRHDLRHEIARRVMRRGSAGESRDDLIAQLGRGEPIVVDGQRLSPTLFAGLVAAAPAARWSAAASARPCSRAGARPSPACTRTPTSEHSSTACPSSTPPSSEWLER